MLRVVILPPYSALVRPRLDCCAQFRTPQYSKGMELLDKMQQRTMRMMKGLKHLLYKERMRELGLLNLEKAQGVLSEVYKDLKKRFKESVARVFLVACTHKTGGNGQILKHRKFPLNIRKNFCCMAQVAQRGLLFGDFVGFPLWRFSKSVWI